MEKEFIPYQQALALKELGFDEDCFSDYFSFNNVNQTLEDDIQLILNEESIDDYCEENNLYPFYICSAPLYQQAFRWFREKYGLEGYVNLSDSKEGDYFYYFNYISTNNIPNRREHCGFFIGNFKSYEEAELECLKKLIEIVKNK
jgi:hypothetical protein